MNSELIEFFKKKQEKDKKEYINWENEKSNWLKIISEFNKNIKNWLEEVISNNYFKLEIKQILLNEMNIGKYKAPSLVIKSNFDSIELKPVGRLVLGFDGRIDMISFTDSKTLVFIKDKGWFLFDKNPKQNLIPFTEELFIELIKEMFS